MSETNCSKARNDRALNVFISWELKRRLQDLAQACDRTVADVVRAVLKIGIPILDGVTKTEKVIIEDQIEYFRRRTSAADVEPDQCKLPQGGGPIL